MPSRPCVTSTAYVRRQASSPAAPRVTTDADTVLSCPIMNPGWLFGQSRCAERPTPVVAYMIWRSPPPFSTPGCRNSISSADRRVSNRSPTPTPAARHTLVTQSPLDPSPPTFQNDTVSELLPGPCRRWRLRRGPLSPLMSPRLRAPHGWGCSSRVPWGRRRHPLPGWPRSA